MSLNIFLRICPSFFFFFCVSDNDCGNPMVAGYQADVDPDDFAPIVTNLKVRNK